MTEIRKNDKKNIEDIDNYSNDDNYVLNQENRIDDLELLCRIWYVLEFFPYFIILPIVILFLLHGFGPLYNFTYLDAYNVLRMWEIIKQASSERIVIFFSLVTIYLFTLISILSILKSFEILSIYYDKSNQKLIVKNQFRYKQSYGIEGLKAIYQYYFSGDNEYYLVKDFQNIRDPKTYVKEEIKLLDRKSARIIAKRFNVFYIHATRSMTGWVVNENIKEITDYKDGLIPRIIYKDGQSAEKQESTLPTEIIPEEINPKKKEPPPPFFKYLLQNHMKYFKVAILILIFHFLLIIIFLSYLYLK
jgi:hypothetical protein